MLSVESDDELSHDMSMMSIAVSSHSTPLTLPKISASVEKGKPPLTRQSQNKSAKNGFAADFSIMETHSAYSASQLSFLLTASSSKATIDASSMDDIPEYMTTKASNVIIHSDYESMLSSGHYLEALEILDKCIFEESAQLNTGIFLSAMECCFAISTSDAIARAVTIGKEFVRLFPREETSHACLTKVYLTKKDWAKAISAATYGMKYLKNSEVLYSLRGHANYEASHFKTAVGDFHKVSEISRMKLGMAPSMTSKALKTWKTTSRK